MLSKFNDTEYSCADGSCIPILEKCNFVPNCRDVKDEESCPKLSFRNAGGYKSDFFLGGFNRARPIIGIIGIIGKYRYLYSFISSDISNSGICIIGIGIC
jgi:hypothetical protein